jgi:hypothetical protein
VALLNAERVTVRGGNLENVEVYLREMEILIHVEKVIMNN